MQDGMQNRPSVFVQLASSSDAERIFSSMNDSLLSYHGRSGALFRGTRLALVPECRPQPPWNLAGLVAAEGHPWGTLRCAPLPRKLQQGP